MVQQLGPYLAFEDWTWKEIQNYQRRVMKEEALYHDMKANMTEEEEQEFGSLVERSRVEKVENWIVKRLGRGRKSVETIADEKHVKVVPVNPAHVKDPPEFKLNGKILWACQEIIDSYTAIYKAMGGPHNRAPGECGDLSRVDFADTPLSEFGNTNEFIHPAVWWRYKIMYNVPGKENYNSKALVGFKRVQDETHGSWGYYKESTKIWIPEWFMKSPNTYLAANKGHDFTDLDGDEDWEHAEWLYTDAVEDSHEIQSELVKVYIDARKAMKSMAAENKVFPWDITGKDIKIKA